MVLFVGLRGAGEIQVLAMDTSQLGTGLDLVLDVLLVKGRARHLSQRPRQKNS